MTNPIPFKVLTYSFLYWHDREPVTVEYTVYAEEHPCVNTKEKPKLKEIQLDCYLTVKNGGPLGHYRSTLSKVNYNNDQMLSVSIWNTITAENHYEYVTGLLAQYYESQ